MNSVQEVSNALHQCMQNKVHAKKECMQEQGAVQVEVQHARGRPGPGRISVACGNFSAPGRGTTDAQKLECNRFVLLLLYALVLYRLRLQRQKI